MSPRVRDKLRAEHQRSPDDLAPVTEPQARIGARRCLKVSGKQERHLSIKQKSTRTTSRSNCDRWRRPERSFRRRRRTSELRAAAATSATSARLTAINWMSLVWAAVLVALVSVSLGSQSLFAEAESSAARAANLFGSRLHEDDIGLAGPAARFLDVGRLAADAEAANVNGDLLSAAADSPSADNNQFANRQGQLLPLPAADQRRPVRQPQPQRVNGQPQPQPQTQLRPRPANPPPPQQQPNRNPQLAPEQLAAANGDPFRAAAQQPGVGVELQPRFQRLRTLPGGNDQFLTTGGAQNQRQPQQPSNQALGIPTLSAFDLSSLANLANQPQLANNQQSVAFRRLPPQQQQPQRNQATAGNLPNPNQVPNNQQQSSPNFNGFNSPRTELPFIRQVFRPAPAPLGSADGSQLAPLIPLLPEQPAAPEEVERPQSGGRPTPPPLFVPSRPIANQNKVTRLVETGGFTGITPPPANREVFFEPTQQRPPQQPATQPRRQSAPLPAQPARQPQPQEQQQQQQQPRSNKPPVVRRPSQRPQVPQANQPQQPVRPQQAQDVIRLATGAIQAANDGLAAASIPTPAGEPDAFSSSRRPEPATEQTGAQAAVTTPAAPTTSSPVAPVAEFAATTVQAPASTRRAAPPPLRNAANFLTLTSAATSPPITPFSPALPINVAMAASNGRRRIPVRGGQRNPAPTTTTSTTTAAAPTTVSADASPTTASSVTRASVTPNSSVRRPEIEEFYETIGGASAAAIDGFGAPSRSTSTSTSTSTTPASTEAERSPPTTQAGDLYGSRLQPDGLGEPAAGAQVERQRQPAEQPAPPAAQPAAQADGNLSPSAVMVPVTYMTTLTYLTTVLHGTHTLETSHESVVRSTRLATLNAQLMDQIEHRLPLVEPTATVSISSKTKGRGTTLVNLKSAVSAYNQELVEALGVPPAGESAAIAPTSSAVLVQPSAGLIAGRLRELQQQQAALQQLARPTRTVELAELQGAKRSLVTEYVYLYTMRPAAAEGEASPVATSTRSELVSASASADLANQLGAGAQLIDSNGLLRLANVDSDAKSGASGGVALNLGSTVGRDGLVTEVNLNLHSYLKFEGISNALVDVRPTLRLERPGASAPEQPQPPARRPQELDASFNVHLTLSNALEQLAGQQTPALDSASRQPSAKTDDLLRATTSQAEQQQQAATRVAVASSSRSALRSRVASSRFRTALNSAALSSPRPTVANSSSSPPPPTPSSGAPQTRARPTKSRISRPSLLKASLASEEAPASSTPSLAPTRSSKPRFVVVTRTGQFGIRASAISSDAASSSAAANEPSTQISELAAPSSASQQPTRVSSRFVNRFQKSRSSQSLADQVAATQVQPAPQVQPTRTSVELDSGLGTPTLPPLDLADIRRPVGAASTTEASSEAPGEQPTTGAEGAGNNLPLGVQLDASSSVVVTYYTTTTHTIPFVMSSQTIFTTLEETNTRIATEHVKDLGSHFIKPTATAAPSDSQIQATASPTEGLAATTSQAPPGEQTTTGSPAQQPPVAAANPIEPSFVVSLNTRTLFTTFTFFTTFAGGQSASPTVVSSESTTSQVVTETVTSAYEPTRALESPTATLLESAPSSSVESGAGLPSSAAPSEQQVQPSAPVTQTLVSTMTYYGTVYNGTQTSLTPIVDVSTQLLTLSSPVFNLNSDALLSSTLAPTQVAEAPQSTATTDQQPPVQTISVADQQPVAPTSALDNDPNKVTRTRSLYTTLTHFITFYSGTKTQLSTIQEISPTVVTEYIDRTLFEQQQQEAAAASSSVLIVPPADVQTNSMPTMTLTPSPVLPMMSSTSTPAEQPPTTTSGPQESGAGEDNQSSGSSTSAVTNTLATTTTTTSTTSTTPKPELESAQADGPQSGSIGPAENQSADARVLPSTSDQAAEGKSSTNIIELSDLIAANSSQNGRVALAGNLGAAIKDIVQLLAGNKTNTVGPLASLPPSVELTTESESSTTTATTPQSSTSTTATPPVTSATSRRNPSRVFGNKAKEQQQQQSLQGSITSPSVTTTSSAPVESGELAQASTRATPELAPPTYVAATARASASQQQPAAATIFFGDDGADERKKQVKTAWSGAQSTVFVTSIEPSTRLLTLTTTKVFYTRDAPLTVTSSLTTAIAPRTFVSTIMGTRTLVNQLNAPTQLVQPPPPQSSGESRQQSTTAKPEASRPTQPSRQEGQAAGHRLSVQAKQQKQQAQVDLAQKKLQQHQQQVAAAAAAKQKALAAAKAASGEASANVNANINQCQPMCKLSNNEICKFTPNSELVGAQGTFSCACRPGYHMMLNSVGQRQCQEVQNYVVLLRLLQIGDQQVAYRRELQDRSSAEFKQYSRVIKDHVKRAYMTSELTRDRFVNADVINYARSLSLQPGAPATTSAASAQPTGGRQPIAVNTSQLGDPLNAGLIVNITVQLQPPPANTNEILDENTLKEELTKKLNMRQAAALAAAAAAAASGGAQMPRPEALPVDSSSAPNSTLQGANWQNSSMDEMLPDPNALFLADVEQVSDLDECANPALNDCHEGAVCINEVGSYKCDCREYPDLNPLHPGRQCASELKACDYCNNRGDCLRVPSLLPPPPAPAHNSSSALTLGNGRGQSFSTVCQCHRIYLGRRCEINGLLLATLLPIVAILLIVSVCLIVYCCRRWRKRSAISKGFRNIGNFGPNMIGGTLDRKAMLESSSESSDTHQRNLLHHHHHLRNAASGIYDTHGISPSDPSTSNESSPRHNARSNQVDGGLLQGIGPAGYHLSPHMVGARQQDVQSQQASQPASQTNSSLGPYCNSIPPQIVIPRARHNQVNYAVHRGQVYMW